MMPRITPMTIPAMAPPLRPPPPAFDSTRVPLAPVGMGAEKGSVAVGEPVAVTPGVGPAIGLHTPSPVHQYPSSHCSDVVHAAPVGAAIKVLKTEVCVMMAVLKTQPVVSAAPPAPTLAPATQIASLFAFSEHDSVSVQHRMRSNPQRLRSGH